MTKMLQALFAFEVHSSAPERNVIQTPTGARDQVMHQSDATGQPLLLDGKFGADIIRFPAGGQVDTHVHDGAHMLFCLAGAGVVEYGSPSDADLESHSLYPGLCYLIPGQVPHAIRATTDLVLIAVGNDHRPVGSPARLDLV